VYDHRTDCDLFLRVNNYADGVRGSVQKPPGYLQGYRDTGIQGIFSKMPLDDVILGISNSGCCLLIHSNALIAACQGCALAHSMVTRGCIAGPVAVGKFTCARFSPIMQRRRQLLRRWKWCRAMRLRYAFAHGRQAVCWHRKANRKS